MIEQNQGLVVVDDFGPLDKQKPDELKKQKPDEDKKKKTRDSQNANRSRRN